MLDSRGQEQDQIILQQSRLRSPVHSLIGLGLVDTALA